MIRNLLFLSCVASSLSVAARSENPVLSPALIQSFQQRFVNIQEVKWQAADDGVYTAEFWKSGQLVRAAFSGDGELLATARKVSPVKLPVVLQAPLRQYPGHWIADATELYVDEKIVYLVTLQSGDETVQFRSRGAEWKTYGKAAVRKGVERLLLP